MSATRGGSGSNHARLPPPGACYAPPSVAHSGSCSGPSQPLVITPGIGIGPFRLGASIGAVLALLQAQPALLRDVPARLISSSTEPATADLTLELSSLGLRLRFDAHSQRLHLIDAFDSARAPLAYMRACLTASSLGGLGAPRSPAGVASPAPNFAQLYSLFGPTFVGKWDADSHLYILQYPGVAMAFPLAQAPSGNEAEGNEQLLRDADSPPLTRLFVHGGEVLSQFHTALPALASGDPYFEPLTLIPGPRGGIFFERRQTMISWSSRAQDLLSEIGPPQNIFVKQLREDKMRIHRSGGGTTGSTANSAANSPVIGPSRHLAIGSNAAGADSISPAPPAAPSASSASVPPTPDYFFNYFHLGLDFLLDGRTHRVKKIVLHTNFVDRAEFGTYARANFVLRSRGEQASMVGNNASGNSSSNRGGLTHLELPPTAVHPTPVVASASLLGRSLSGSSNGSGHNGGVHHSSGGVGGDVLTAVTPSPSPQPLPPSHQQQQQRSEQDFSLHVAEDGNDANGGGGSGGGKKKKKKKGGGSAAAESKQSEAESHAAANHAVLAAVAQESAAANAAAATRSASHSPLLSPSSPPLQSFSPSLSPSVLPLSHAECLGPLSKWSDVLAVMGPCPSRPMVASALSAAGGGSGGAGGMQQQVGLSGGASAAASSPFGSTYFYAYEDGIVFEVMKNHQLNSLTLIDPRM